MLMLSRSSIFTDTLTLSRPTADQDSEQRNQLDDRFMLWFHPHNNKSQLLITAIQGPVVIYINRKVRVTLEKLNFPHTYNSNSL